MHLSGTFCLHFDADVRILSLTDMSCCACGLAYCKLDTWTHSTMGVPFFRQPLIASRAIPKYWEQYRQGHSLHSPLTVTHWFLASLWRTILKMVQWATAPWWQSSVRASLQGKPGDGCFWEKKKNCLRSFFLITAIMEENRVRSNGVCWPSEHFLVVSKSSPVLGNHNVWCPDKRLQSMRGNLSRHRKVFYCVWQRLGCTVIKERTKMCEPVPQKAPFQYRHSRSWGLGTTDVIK